MYSLFSTDKTTLPDLFQTISKETIKDCCELKIYHRGVEYSKSGSVAEANYNRSKTILTSIVKGNYNYSVVINLQNNEISGTCSCPYEGICKHTIATLLYAIDYTSEIEVIKDALNTDDATSLHLRSLSKEQLIRLVQKFAPEQYFVEIKNTVSDRSTAQSIFKKAERNIQKIFNNSENLYDPSEFDSSLDKEIKKLFGLEKQLKEEIESLLFYIMHEVDNAFDEGYLYDHYSDYNYEPSQEFNQFISNYVCCMNYEEKIAFITKLDALLSEQSYTTFDNFHKLSETIFTDDNLPLLKNMLVADFKNISHQLIENYYERVRDLLSSTEKEIILTHLNNNNSKWILELSQLFESQNEVPKAIEVIQQWLSDHNNGYNESSVYIRYLDLLKKAQYPLLDAAKRAVTNCSTSIILQKTASMVDKDELLILEQILVQKYAGEFLDYLEKNGRLTEALALIQSNKKIEDSQIYSFFKKNKKQFPLESEKYFCQIIKKNLEYTGDKYYYFVAEAMQQLQQCNTLYANEYLKNIRIEYKRRTKLISILSQL